MRKFLLFLCDYSNHIKNLEVIRFGGFADLLNARVYFAINSKSYAGTTLPLYTWHIQ